MQRTAEVSRTAEFDAFYRRERATLYRALALTLRDADLAAEAVDEGMVRAYQNWWRIHGYDNPAGWVYRVALNWAISRTRVRSRSVAMDRLPEQSVEFAEPADAALARAIAALPSKTRAVVVLRFHMDWSVEQVAAALRVPPGTVKSRLHRGLAALRSELEEVGRES
jgi:RNA polymerase sigma-70 factor (ECF subfamily)